MRHPEVRDVCDLGQAIFWNKKWAFYFTAVMFILNSKFLTPVWLTEPPSFSGSSSLRYLW